MGEQRGDSTWLDTEAHKMRFFGCILSLVGYSLAIGELMKLILVTGFVQAIHALILSTFLLVGEGGVLLAVGGLIVDPPRCCLAIERVMTIATNAFFYGALSVLGLLLCFFFDWALALALWNVCVFLYAVSLYSISRRSSENEPLYPTVKEIP